MQGTYRSLHTKTSIACVHTTTPKETPSRIPSGWDEVQLGHQPAGVCAESIYLDGH